MYGSNHTIWERKMQELMQDPEYRERRERMAQSQQEHDREVCERYSAAPYKLERVVEGITLAPSLPVFPLAIGMALDGRGNKYAPLALSAVSALTVVPFIMKLPMRKASYGRRAAVGNGILALLGAAWGLHIATKERKRACDRAMEMPRQMPPPGRGYPIGRPAR